MTIYIATNSDGKGTEGIGAMAQYQMACYALAKVYGVSYSFSGFKNLTHYQYFDVTQQKFCEDVNDYFRFPNEFNQNCDYEVEIFDSIDNRFTQVLKLNTDSEENVLCIVSPKALMDWLQANVDFINSNGYLKQLRNQSHAIKPENGKLNIAVHVRKFTQTDCDPNPVRDLFDSSKLKRLVELCSTLSTTMKNSEIHVYSQGNDLEVLPGLVKDGNIRLHLDEYPTLSLDGMINSDVLVAANSSLSYVAHLFGKPVTLVRDSFYHKMISSNTIYMDSNYQFDLNKLKILLEQKHGNQY
jgi:hypothetical protein